MRVMSRRGEMKGRETAETAAAWKAMWAGFKIELTEENKEVLRFLYAITVWGEQDPDTRTVSLSGEADDAWHALIIDERVYAVVIAALCAVTGNRERPWHAPREPCARRQAEWRRRRVYLFPELKKRAREEGAAVPPTEPHYTVSSLNGSGESIYIPARKVGDDCTVAQFKELLSEESGVPTDQMRLIYNGKAWGEDQDHRCVVDMVGGTPQPGASPNIRFILRLRGC